MSENDIAFEAMAKKIKKIPSLTPEREKELFSKWQTNKDQKAFNELFESHLKMVVKMAFQKSRKSGVPAADLFQEGSIGLMRAVEKFDTERGNQLAAYASSWIRAHMNTVVDERHLVSVGTVLLRKLLPKLLEFKRRRGHLGRLTADEEKLFAEKCRLSVGKVQELDLVAVNPVFFLHDVFLLKNDEDSSLEKDILSIADVAFETNRETQEESVIKKETQKIQELLVKEAVVSALKNERERYIFEQRELSCGIAEDGPTLDDIGQELGISRERVRQIQEKAFLKVAAHLKRLRRAKRISTKDLLG